MIQLALDRTTEDIKDLNNESVAKSGDKKPTVSSNTEVILFDENLNQLITGIAF